MLFLIQTRISKCWKDWCHGSLGLSPLTISIWVVCSCLVADAKILERFVAPSVAYLHSFIGPGSWGNPGTVHRDPHVPRASIHSYSKSYKHKKMPLHLYNSCLLLFVIGKQISSWPLIGLHYRTLFCLMPTDGRSIDGELLFRKLQTDTQCQSHGNHSDTVEPLWLHYCKSALYYLG